MTDILEQIFASAEVGAFLKSPPCSKRAPAEIWLRAGSNRASRLLASIVLLAKISRSKTPERVDAVGVAPTASKVFRLDVLC